MPQLLYLMTRNVANLNSGKKPSITLYKTFNSSTGTETVKTGEITRSEYVKMANTIKSYMVTYNRAPSYVTTSRGKIKYETMVYTFSKILYFQKTNKRLPNYVKIVPWSTVIIHVFSSAQINNASVSVKKYIEKYKKLPSYVTIGTAQVTMPQLLKLMTQNIMNIKNGTVQSITLKKMNSPSIDAAETIKDGKVTKKEYLKLAYSVNSYMTNNYRAPSYLTTSIGKINYKTMVYTFSKTLLFYYKFHYMPGFISLTSWDNLHSKSFSLRPVYITCDLISCTTVDTARNNALAGALQDIGVNAANYGVKNAVWKLLEDKSVPDNALIIEILGGADAAYIKEKGSSWYQYVLGNKIIFLVFTDCAKDITDLAWLERAHDDNYSPDTFKGIAHPDQYLLTHDIGYFEPLTTTNYDTCAEAIYLAAANM